MAAFHDTDNHTEDPLDDVGVMECGLYHSHMRWTLPLPLASVVPRHTPRRASAQLMT